MLARCSCMQGRFNGYLIISVSTATATIGARVVWRTDNFAYHVLTELLIRLSLSKLNSTSRDLSRRSRLDFVSPNGSAIGQPLLQGLFLENPIVHEVEIETLTHECFSEH